jgi:manganese/zinc/iron transport system permease protein
MNSSDLIILLTGSFIAITCSLLGCFLVLRKMAMVGDAISHSVLPGIVIAYLISGSRDSLTMIIGAGIVGILTTLLIENLHSKIRLQEDATIGVVFTTFFSIGVILISANAENIDLDQDCVLYGELAHIPLDSIYLNGVSVGPPSMYIAGGLLLTVLVFVMLFFRKLQVTTFDPGFAASLGISTLVWHYALMSMVSITTVISFEAVGAILVVAFLIVPAATAYLITTKLNKMLKLATLIALLSTIGGYYMAYLLDASIAGSMSTVAGIIFMLVFLVHKKLNQLVTAY